MPKLRILIFILSVFLFIFINLLIFATSNTKYEYKIRETIFYTIDYLYKNPNQSENSVATFYEQNLVLDMPLIAMSEKLVIANDKILKIFLKSESSGVMILSYFNYKDQKVINKFKFKGEEKKSSVLFNTLSGFDLSNFRTFEFNLPNDISGWVAIKIVTENESLNIPVFIEGPKYSDILFIESTETLKAYSSSKNRMRSNYEDGPAKIGGNFTRPHSYPIDYELVNFNSQPNYLSKKHFNFTFGCHDHLINADFVLKAALNKYGINFDIASDEFLTPDKDLSMFKLIIFGTHNEYWAKEKILNIKKYLDGGGNILFLGGNTAWRFVENIGDFDIFWGGDIRNTSYADFITKYLGSYYDIKGYNTESNFKVSQGATKSGLIDDHEVGLDFGKGSDFVECKEKVLGASGHETDKIIDVNNPNHILLAKGQNPDNGGAQISYKILSSGGKILNFGSLTLWHRMSDELIENIIKRFVNKLYE